MTILIIAHRLSSIRQAKNLLFIESRSHVSTHKQGSKDYEDALNRLKNFTYAYGDGVEEEQEQSKIDSIRETFLSFQQPVD